MKRHIYLTQIYGTKQLPWYPGETLNIGIGQGYFLATPMQLTLGTSVLAGNGKTYLPHLLLALVIFYMAWRFVTK